MASPIAVYQREMHEKLGKFATWLPGSLVEVGDVGSIDDGVFKKQTSLKELVIAFRENPCGTQESVQYTSTAGTKVTFSVDATSAIAGSGSIAIDLSQSGAFVFHASGLRAKRLESRAAIGAKVVAAFERGAWQKDWVLVDEVHSAARTTVVISQDGSASLTLAAKATGPIAGLSLADPSMDLAVTGTRGSVFHLVGGKNQPLLYTRLRVERSLFGKASWRAGAEIDPFVELTY